MTQKVYFFGPRSIVKAQQHVQKHPGQTLVMLKAPDRRIAVCGPSMAAELKTQGFAPIDAEA
ncbi:hypothetical protein [Aggregatilinea lenta]|uniref:hypothetical protein n=1 Tax=Aggregatilinea lenta TaxID=913108 RepID=UPI0013C2EF3D|nr:hypothetical protein [Aggregatilinea lenta]